MKILLTGATGYIGRRLLPVLFEAGHEIITLVRSAHRLDLPPRLKSSVQVVEADLLDPECPDFPKEVDAAYYLVHSMGQRKGAFSELEAASARHFAHRLKKTRCQQLIYLSGLSHDVKLSRHLASRRHVEEVLAESGVPLTILRAGIIIGAGSASFEIIRDLVEKLPVMVAPKWVLSRSQPIAIYDVIDYLLQVLGCPGAIGETFDIGGPDILSYKEMMQRVAKIRGLHRLIITVPVLTPHLSSLWLYFVSATNFSLAQALVDSLKNNVTCQDDTISQLIPKECIPFDEAVSRAFSKIEEHTVVSSWRDAWQGSRLNPDLAQYIQIPHHGCLTDHRAVPLKARRSEVLERIWSIGGDTGWYALNWAWFLRGWVDKLFGGPGMRRGRTHRDTIHPGDALDFWRVLLADPKEGRLLLYAEMKVPGEAWLEFRLDRNSLHQTATFRPHGLLGRLYWYTLYPIHAYIFSAMVRKLTAC